MPGAIAGPQLGEAAHRLVKNTLNIKFNNASHGFVEQPYQNIHAHHMMNRIRPPGSSGYGKYYGEDTSSHYAHYNNHHGTMNRPRFPNGGQNDRQNFRIQDRSHYQEPLHNVKTGFSALTLEEGARSRSSAMVSPKPPATSSRMPNSGSATYLQHQYVQNIGPPIPPPKWITKAPTVNGVHTRHQEAAYGIAYDKQMKKVYQVKTRHPQDVPEHGDQ